MNDIERVLIFLLILGAFAFVGYRRGFFGEMIKFGLIVVGYLINEQNFLGGRVLKIINLFWLLLQVLLNGGISALLSSGLDLDKLKPAVAAAKAKGDLIPQDHAEEFLLLLMVASFILAFILSARIRKKSSHLLGLFMGLVNGLTLTYIFYPYLSGTPLLTPIKAQTVMGRILEIFGNAFDIFFRPLSWLYGVVDTWIVPLLIVIIVLIGLFSMRPARKGKG